MKIYQTPSYDRFCLFDAEKKSANFQSMKEVQKYSGNEPADNVVISEEGLSALREKLKEVKPEVDEPEAYELTTQNTNEVEWEHYTAMREMSSLTLKDGNYDVEDVMKSIMDAYETLYNQIVKEHEDGDRQVSYELTGESKLSLEEDLDGLDRAFRRCLANLAGYITCLQTSDGSKYFHSTDIKNEAVKLKEYRDTAVSMMKQAREEFMTCVQSGDYRDGIGGELIAGIINNNKQFKNFHAVHVRSKLRQR